MTTTQDMTKTDKARAISDRFWHTLNDAALHISIDFSEQDPTRPALFVFERQGDRVEIVAPGEWAPARRYSRRLKSTIEWCPSCERYTQHKDGRCVP